MRVTKLKAHNFKSLVDFELELSPFNCLVGLNGSGKSTVLQFIDFLSQQMRGDFDGWLASRSWKPKDLKSHLTKKGNIEFSVRIRDGQERSCTWEANFNTQTLRCTWERIITPDVYLIVKQGRLTIRTRPTSTRIHPQLMPSPVAFEYQGSILSQLLDVRLPAPLVELKEYFLAVRSHDLLSPELLRQRTRGSEGYLGLGGQKIAAFIHELGDEKKARLAKQLKKVYPHLDAVLTRSLRSGWKQLEIVEHYGSKVPPFNTEARHINDGLLRLMAILAVLESDHRFVLFDEIENGINPELIEFVLDTLTTTRKQVLVTTHSPMILNYLEDEIARSGVIYLYKTGQGATKATRFFSIPSLEKKLSVMGPGEAFADTDLKALVAAMEML